MSLLVGEISEITRYPVKSFQGESLKACKVDTYGIHGDRFCAFYDETKEGWDSYITARDIPSMLAYKAQLIDKEVSVSSPDGEKFSWNEELLKEIQKYSNKKISMTNYRAPNPEDPNLMAVDLASVHVITDSSLRKLESMYGMPLDKRRFRANIIVSIYENTFNESNWIGKCLLVGDAELQVTTFCERCSVITIDPDSVGRDTTLLKKVNEQLDLKFGVYASVKKTGEIQVGQKVYLSD
ncbi:uncharacterized protein YcbX [Paenibacillus mucilaginosus]|uniref:MOSC domain-containing protein n=1 Tax=Paenibacillus mucilaginosus TaxID=61624 RepID=UPI003D1A177E